MNSIDDLWDFGDPEATEKKFRDALEDTPEDNVEHRAELLTQIARTHSLRAAFDEAHKVLDTVADVLPDVGDRIKTRYLLERGRTYNSAGEKVKAKELFLQAVDTGKQAGDDNLTVDAMHMMGIVEDPDAAIEWTLRAFSVLDKTKSEKARHWIGPLSNNLGWTYHDRGDFETALTYFVKGHDYRSEAAKEPGYRIAKWAVARCKRSLGSIEEALQEQEAILKEYYPGFELRGAIDTDGYVTEEIGECLFALGKAEEAKPYFKDAFERLSKDDWLAKNEPDRIARLKVLGG